MTRPILLDTNILIWALNDDRSLTRRMRAAITSPTADVHVSEDRVIWSRIGRETYNYMPEGWELNLRSGPVGFAFDAREYEQALR